MEKRKCFKGKADFVLWKLCILPNGSIRSTIKFSAVKRERVNCLYRLKSNKYYIFETILLGIRLAALTNAEAPGEC